MWLLRPGVVSRVLVLGVALATLHGSTSAQSSEAIGNEKRLATLEAQQISMDTRLTGIENTNRGILIVVLGQLILSIFEVRVRRKRAQHDE